MLGFHERTEACACVFHESLNESQLILRDAARIAVDRKVGIVSHINASLFTVSVSAMMVPLAAGEAVYAFIKPAKSPVVPA
jgi:hypothetical protein